MAVTMNYGAAPTYVKIASTTLTGSASSYTFSNVPQGYTDLVLITTSLSNGGAATKHSIRVNGDSGNNYSTTAINGTGSAAESWRQSSNSTNDLTNYGASTTNTTIPNTSIANFMSYSNPSIRKTIISRFNSSYGEVTATVANWNNTSPITSITMTASGTSGSFASGSTFTLYGIKAAFVPKASGGDIIVQDGTYWYHAFKSTGAFVPRQSLTADVLVVAGGGGSGASTSGNYTSSGGGAGGYLKSTGISVSSAATVTVGAGGAAVNVGTNNGNSGSNSQFGSVTASVGGGFGGSNVGAGTNPGGSGGGASVGATPGAGTAGQGYAGGNGGPGAANYTGGGGGGAGAVGSAGTSSNGGAGGIGTNADSTWLSVVGMGVSGYVAGGGGGGSWGAGLGGAGGSGGGGLGGGNSTQLSGVSGTANTGGGAGGGGNGGHGASGGSGFVIVRYPI